MTKTKRLLLGECRHDKVERHWRMDGLRLDAEWWECEKCGETLRVVKYVAE